MLPRLQEIMNQVLPIWSIFSSRGGDFQNWKQKCSGRTKSNGDQNSNESTEIKLVHTLLQNMVTLPL